MTTREEALAYGLSFPDTYQEAPFHDQNWQLVRVKGSKKAFLWTYERNGYINLNGGRHLSLSYRVGIRTKNTGTLSYWMEVCQRML